DGGERHWRHPSILLMTQIEITRWRASARVAIFQISVSSTRGTISMLTIGDKLPASSLKAVTRIDAPSPDEAFEVITNESYPGKWLVLFAWPKDFTFVCPTEIAAFGKPNSEFADRDAQVLGMSTDNEFVHLAWRRDHEDLRDLPFPMLSDLKRDLSSA